MSQVLTTAHSVVAPSPLSKRIAGTIVILYAIVSMIPLAWILMTGFKTPPDSIAYPPKLVFDPSLEGYCNLITTRTRQTQDYIQSLGAPKTTCDEITHRITCRASGIPSSSLSVPPSSRSRSACFRPMPFRVSRYRWPTISCSSSCRHA